jgi:hypothetical protein
VASDQATLTPATRSRARCEGSAQGALILGVSGNVSWQAERAKGGKEAEMYIGIGSVLGLILLILLLVWIF